MKKFIIIILFLIIPCLLFAQETIRTWKSQTGKTIIEAAWDSEKDSEPETVFFLKEGRRYKYPLEKLSDADQKYVTDGRAKKAQRGTEDDPDLVLVDETPKPLTLGGFKLPMAKKYAVLIGVTDYVTMNDLKYTVRDVEAIRAQLLEIGFQEENVQMLTTGSDVANQPTQRNIHRAVKSALDQAKIGDLVFFAFAGHGAQLGDEVFFCPQDTVDEDISNTAVSITKVMEDLSKSDAYFKWILVDACRNNPFRNRVAGVRSIQKIDDPPKGIALFQSCAQDEYSYEDESVEHGLFTSNFVKGMQGKADSNNDGVLTFMEVCTFTTSQTARDVQQKFRANQRPYLSGNITDFVLMEDLNRPKAIACFNAARKFLKEKKYGEAKIQIEQALKLCPNTPEYLEERDIIQGFIELVNSTPGGFALPTPVSLPSAVDNVSVVPGDVTLSFLFNPNPNQYEKFWEKKGFSGFVALSRDGKYLAVRCGNDIKILEFSTGKILQTLQGHTDSVWSVSYSPDGRFLASGCKDNTIRIWNTQTGECLKTLEEHTESVTSVSYSPDGRLLASGSFDDTVRIWNTQTGTCVKVLQNNEDSVKSVSYSPDGRFIASGSSDDTVRIWNTQTGECVQTLEGHTSSVTSVSHSPDGKFIASGSFDETVRIWNAQTGACVQTLQGHTDSVWSVSYSPDGRFIVSGCADNTIRIWNVQTGECVQTLEGHTGAVDSVSYSPDGRFIASGSYDNTVRIWNSQTGTCVKALLDHEDDVRSVSYSPDGRFIASGTVAETVRIWNAQTGECMKTLQGHTNPVWSVSYSPDGRFIASGSFDDTVRIWNAQTGECVQTLEGHTGAVDSVSYSPDGRFLASGGGYGDKTIRIWNAQTGECMKTLQGHTDPVWSVSYSPDGRFLVSGCEDKTIRIWNVQTGECVQTLEGHTEKVNSVSYSPDGRFIASGGGYKDNTVRIWNAQTGACVQTLQGHTGAVNSVSYSLDGRFIVSGGGYGDKTICIWNVQTGECVKTLQGYTGELHSLNYSPDGKYISAGAEYGLTVWRVAE